MANLYGVATPNPLPVGALTIGGVDINCPPGVETNVVAITVNNPTVNGFYYPAFGGWLVLSMGATPPTAINLGFRLNGGADMASLPISALLFAPSGSLVFPVVFQSSGTIVNNPTGVNVFQVSLQAGTTAFTCRTAGSFVQGWWVRSTDQ